MKKGDKAYVLDNSYSLCLTTGESSYVVNGKSMGLAGDAENVGVKVTIVSDPINIKIKSFCDDIIEREMVIVEYNNCHYLVLNQFQNKPIEWRALFFHNNKF